MPEKPKTAAFDFIAAAFARIAEDEVNRSDARFVCTLDRMKQLLFAEDNANILPNIDDEVLSIALRALSDELDMIVFESEYASTRYVFYVLETRNYIVSSSDNSSSAIQKAVYTSVILGWDWLIESISRAYAGERAVAPVVKDEWAPLPIEEADEDFANCVELLSNLADRVRDDNGYAAAEPAERDEVVSRLDAGAKLFNHASLVTVTSIQVYVVWPLERLLTRFPAKTAIGAAAVMVRDVFKEWLKQHGVKLLDGLF